MSFLIVFAVFNFALVLNVKEVSGQSIYDTCLKTDKGDYCREVPTADSAADFDDNFKEHTGDECSDGKYWGTVRDDIGLCDVGWCEPTGVGSCLENYEKVRCEEDEFGAWSETQLDGCIDVCCKTDTTCALGEKRSCEGTPIYEDTTVESCNANCDMYELGCYKASGICEYGVKSTFSSLDSFDSNGWFMDQYCCNVAGCPDIDCAEFIGCGPSYYAGRSAITDDDKFNVYGYDAGGNRGSLIEACNTSLLKCVDADENIFGEVPAECVSTSCFENVVGASPSHLWSGESVCANVLSGKFLNSERSKYLDNFKIVCEGGEPKVEYFDSEYGRDYRCVESTGDDDRTETDWIKNEWENCHGCGESNTMDIFGIIPLIGAPFAAGVLGKPMCVDNEEWGGWEKCTTFGDCGGVKGENEKYDRDFIWSPFGSCNSLYPPAPNENGKYSNEKSESDQCGKCGKGDSDKLNVCTKAECNALGDCYFDEDEGDEVWKSAAGLFAGTVGGAMVGCWALQALPGGQSLSLGCASGVASSLVAFGWPMLGWGTIFLVYGIGAEVATIDNYVPADDSKDGENLKLAYAILMTKEIIDEEGGGSDWHIAGDASMLTADVVAYALGNIIIEEFQKRMGEWVFRRSLEKAGVVVGKTLVKDVVVEGVTIVAGDVTTYTIATAGNQAATKALGATLVQKIGFVLQVIGIFINVWSLQESFNEGSCKPEKAYKNSDRCEQCGPVEGQWFCTEERCGILGGDTEHCIWLPKEESGELDGYCVENPGGPSDIDPPEIKKIEVKFLDELDTVVDIPSKDDLQTVEGTQLIFEGLVPYLESQKIWINLTVEDETGVADCGIAWGREISYEGSVDFPYDPGLIHEGVFEIPEIKRNGDQPVELFIKCEDFVGNEIGQYTDDNFIKFEFDEAPDSAVPVIDKIFPESPWYPEGTSSVDGFKVYVYDPGLKEDIPSGNGCKYHKDSVNWVDYTETLTELAKETCPVAGQTCQVFGGDINLEELESFGEYNEEAGKNITFYTLNIMCQDASGNTAEAYPWYFSVQPKGEINITKPLDEKVFEVVDVELEVETSSDTLCEYDLDGVGFEPFNLISNGYFKIHSILLENLTGALGGQLHTVDVECKDIGRNILTDSANFYVKEDYQEPQILQVYEDGNLLKLVLDEPVICEYVGEVVDWAVYSEIGDFMILRDYSTEKELNMIDDVVAYSIKCADVWENELTLTVYT